MALCAGRDGAGRGGWGQESSSHTPECAPSVMRVGRRLVLRGRAAPTHFSGGERETAMGRRGLQFHGPGGHPSSHIPDLPGNPSLLPPPPPPPPCDCKRQQTLHGSFTPINQPDRQARMGPTGSGVSQPSLCLGSAFLSAAPLQPLHFTHPKIPRMSQTVLTPSPTSEWGN